MEIKKARRSEQWLRVSFGGPAGAGKTFTVLRVAHALAKLLGYPEDSIGLIDSENGSGALYAGEENPDGGVFDYFHVDLSKEPGKFSAANYIKALHAMHRAGVKIVICDSLSHAWAGEGGILEFVDAAGERAKGNKFAGWKAGTPEQNKLIQSILNYPGHVLCTMRTKVEYVQEGKQIRKVGTQPIQRDGIEYEFSLVLDMDPETHRAVVTKTRISSLTDRSFIKPGMDLAHPLITWLNSAEAPEPKPVVAKQTLQEQADADQAAHHDAMDAEDNREPKPEPDAEATTPAPEPEHHPSWPADQKRFFARLKELNFTDYEEVKRFSQWFGRPVPKKMEQDQRDNFLKFLGSATGAKKYKDFLEGGVHQGAK